MVPKVFGPSSHTIEGTPRSHAVELPSTAKSAFRPPEEQGRFPSPDSIGPSSKLIRNRQDKSFVLPQWHSETCSRDPSERFVCR
ncbi:hypothetical protein CEXT_166401 [Caerostris extrusa]|uniref:Uncharacterized protein n=1 Tax=Caerostris extrusa TaxID=172846 RepID=A0AAV4V6H4_CAEEX|nr:hypothetical protein CEXT_166401 [Caerostris extrusa]